MRQERGVLCAEQRNRKEKALGSKIQECMLVYFKKNQLDVLSQK